MKGVFSFNGIRSDQFGIYVEEYPLTKKPTRKLDRYSVPGRNGDIIMMQDAWDNVEQEYKVFAGDASKMAVHDVFAEIMGWLSTPKGYCELWDDFDQDHFRMAFFKGSLDVEALSLGRIGKSEIVFDCKPQRFRISGKAEIAFASSSYKIFNPTAYEAKPRIEVYYYGSGRGTVTVNGTVFTISSIPYSGLFIDCETMNCYDGNGANCNRLVSSSSATFATLSPGINEIGYSGSVNGLAIVPNWFDI